jgi:putative transcriptional regulator
MTSSLKIIRVNKGLTQEQLAALVNVSRQSIISVESGQYIPTTLLALKLAVALKVKVEDLFVLEKGD